MKKIADWVKAAREKAGLTQEKLAEHLHMTKGNVSAWENDRHEPSYQQIIAIARLTKMPLPEGDNVRLAEVGGRRVPLISDVTAGMWKEVVDSYVPGDGDEMLYTDIGVSRGSFALEITGKSMLPEFHEGDRVIIDPNLRAQPGDFVAAKNGENEATFKKYRPRGIDKNGNEWFELVPLNEDFPILRSDIQPIEIIGVMVEHRKYRKR